MYAAMAIIGIVGLVALWWVTTAGPRRRALREMGGETARFVVGYLGGHPGLWVSSPLVMATLSLTPQGLLIHVPGQFARIRFTNLVEAIEDEWQGAQWRGRELSEACGQTEDRRMPLLRVTFLGDDGFTESALFVCQGPEAGAVAEKIMGAAGESRGA